MIRLDEAADPWLSSQADCRRVEEADGSVQVEPGSGRSKGSTEVVNPWEALLRRGRFQYWGGGSARVRGQ